jgi:hypothetical protein
MVYEWGLLVSLFLLLWVLPATKLFKKTTLIIKAALILDILFFISITMFSILVK